MYVGYDSREDEGAWCDRDLGHFLDTNSGEKTEVVEFVSR